MSNNKDPEIRYCKKCGCELVSTNKYKLCDNCRREKYANIRKGVVGIGGIIISVYYLWKGNRQQKQESKNDKTSVDDSV